MTAAQETTDAPPPPAPPAPPAWRALLRTEHLGLALTLGYLFLTALGMLHRALVFLLFRINVFDYAEPADFLLAALRDPLIILVCIAPIPVVWGYFRISYGMQKRAKATSWIYGGAQRRELSNRYRRPLFIASVFVWALAASLHYAKSVATDLRAGVGRRVRIELVNAPTASPLDTTPQLLLGTTHQYFFLYDATRQVTTVIPASNVARIRIERRKAATPSQ
ncbi:MAG: hypothetical protein ABIY52_17205 [Gemmatimonadaceae bacterium]